MNIPQQCDVVIIGGGPAGSTAATILARKGYKVVLLEKEKFPRDRVGESMLPFCYELFRELGVLVQMEKRFARKPGVRFISSDGSASTYWCFDRVIKDESYLSFQVNRSEFDTILLENSRKHGAEVREETRVDVCSLDVEGSADKVEVQAISRNGERLFLQTRFIIDASGRCSFIASSKGWRKEHKGFARTALWTHWKGIKSLKGGLEEGSSIILYLGGEKKGWAWVFPLGVDWVTVGVVMDTAYLNQKRQELQGSSVRDWCSELYQQELNYSEFIKELLQGATISMPVQVEGDYSYYSENKFSTKYAMVGDANRFLDPIFSSGVFLSMKSSFLVANAVDKMLSSNQTQDRSYLEEAYAKINGAYDFVYRLISLFYQPHALSWAEAGAAFNSVSQVDYKRHEVAMAAGHYMLAGNFFENYEKYHKFLDMMEKPRWFEGYKNLVIDREEYQTESCGVARSLIFPVLTTEVS
ncbi:MULTISPECIES: FAD-dependent oxidoreductase [unclassified Microcoleus]|uniref:FAD-dependent oxidoreductase n=1 Tax=unclassified Microcoleus TaxID=2642155 RepID=UPI002FD2A7A8